MLIASLWSVVTLGMGKKPKKTEETEYSETLLANQSLLFILVLVNHCTTERVGVNNPYRQALFFFTDSNRELCFFPHLLFDVLVVELKYSTIYF